MDKSKIPAPGCIDSAWCTMDCSQCWGKYEKRIGGNMKTTIETKNSKVLEVKSTWNESEANTLLASGKWTLLHGGLAHKDDMGFTAKPVYILGRISE